MAKVFIVTSGEYSDYGINAVFSTRELAEQYLDTKDDDYGIEEYDLDEPIVKDVKLFGVKIKLGNKEVQKCFIESCISKKDCFEYYDKHSTYLDEGEGIIFYIESDSRERAIKIASERFGAVIANEQILYPHLREKIVRDKMFYITEYDYPLYNFRNGNVVLLGKCELVEDVSGVSVESRERVYN